MIPSTPEQLREHVRGWPLGDAKAASAGFYLSPWGKHARRQTLTVEDSLTGKTIDRPPAQMSVTFDAPEWPAFGGT